MAGHTLPFSLIKNPCIGEPSNVVVGLALIRARRVINPGDNSGIAKEVDLQILNIGLRGFESRIFYIGQEFLLVADLAVPLSVHEPAGNKRVEGRGIAVDLRFIPKPFQNHQLAFARISLLRR